MSVVIQDGKKVSVWEELKGLLFLHSKPCELQCLNELDLASRLDELHFENEVKV